MSWRTSRTGSRPPSRPPAWGDPSRIAELHLLKFPAERTSRSFAAKQKNLIGRFADYVIFLSAARRNRSVETSQASRRKTRPDEVV